MDSSFFTANRRLLADNLESKLIVITAYSLQQEHNDVAFPFRQESNFYYLTGLSDPDWLLIIDSKSNTEYLIAPEVDDIHAIFEGSTTREIAAQKSGVNTIVARKDLADLLRRLAQKYTSAHTLSAHPWRRHFNFSQNPAQSRLNRNLGRYFETIEDCRTTLAKQRAIKQPQEIEEIRRAISVTGEALDRVRKLIEHLHYEHEVEAEISYHFRKRGLHHAYQPIVASGKNACTLHHSASGDLLETEKPILIDVGALSNGYAADISRTLAYGHPTDRQAALYHELQQAHQNIVSMLKPGLSIQKYLEKSDEYMKVAIKHLGLAEQDYRVYFPHAISHGLGLDVHESLGGYKNFQPGMVLTVEPGIYLTQEGIGMRIEDNILISDAGHENLSDGISTEFHPSSIINR